MPRKKPAVSIIPKRGGQPWARRKLRGREAEITEALTVEKISLLMLSERLGVSRQTLTNFIREEMEGQKK